MERPLELILGRPFFKKVILGYLTSIGVYSIAYVPVLAFTFIGLSQTPYLVETNPRLNELLQTHGLGFGMLYGYLSSLEYAAVILGGAHLVYIRPVVFSMHRDLRFARKVVTSLTGLLLLFWGWTFFIDAYNDMGILLESGIWNEGSLWTIFLVCLGLFLAGLVIWGVIMQTATSIPGKDDGKGTWKLATLFKTQEVTHHLPSNGSTGPSSHDLLDKPGETNPLL